jgi:uncharacterized membrane protein YwzB
MWDPIFRAPHLFLLLLLILLLSDLSNYFLENLDISKRFNPFRKYLGSISS